MTPEPKNPSSPPFPAKPRIHIICEGQTEEMFVNVVLRPHFDSFGTEVIPRILGAAGHQGGNVSYKRVMTDIRLLLQTDPFSWITTFIDFYGIYATFPGVREAKHHRTAQERFEIAVEAFLFQLAEDFQEKASRIIPYIQMHEFEGLLFSSPEDIAKGILQPHLWKKFAKILFEFESPEDINDSIETAPSKRILHIFRGYQKVLHGSIIARRTGLERIRSQCPLFNAWVETLEQIQA
ncbi:MAG: DUF4276 family protein [Planctomycetaceae bacterium]|jgi:hypothetical protein|nr:DUF4276 family protein [Planctomycetaceae bacterium]